MERRPLGLRSFVAGRFVKRSTSLLDSKLLAMGHPIGASGERITMNLAYALRAGGPCDGGAIACCGGSEAFAVLLETSR